MQMILILAGISFFSIILGKINWKSTAVKYTIIAAIALAQTLFILYKMLSMQFPFVF
jgi:hypothetical protein